MSSTNENKGAVNRYPLPGVATPILPADIANKAYVDAAISTTPKLELIKTYTAASAESTTGTALDPASPLDMDTVYSALLIIGSIHETAADLGQLELEVNNEITTYSNWGYKFDGSTMTQKTGITDSFQLAATEILVASTGVTFKAILILATSGGNRDIHYTGDAHGDLAARGAEHWEGNHEIGQATITEIMIKAEANWNVGTNITLYGIRRVT